VGFIFAPRPFLRTTGLPLEAAYRNVAVLSESAAILKLIKKYGVIANLPRTVEFFNAMRNSVHLAPGNGPTLVRT
jgi:hypothetical protein